MSGGTEQPVRAPGLRCLGVASLAVLLLGAAPVPAEDVPALLRAKTDRLLDAITRGDGAVWDQELDARARMVDEAGVVSDKRTFVAGIRPLPPGVSGVLRVTDFEATVHGDTAVTTYVADETETFHGARLRARYRTTETWIRREGAWKLVASQALALRADPPAVPTTPEQLRVYCGRYALSDLTYVVRCEAEGLTGGQLGRTPRPLRLESPDVFFVPGEPRTRRIFQRDAAGHITGFVERRESWDLFWKRVD